ncbi:DUF305 domain-containing protein [Amorphus orientalis]|uniref:DUF305 domain-containing protein n=1 Tax=Amorphus orientalis TaxID=649198 RepID=A0AAE3VRC3_9HYPH|nr:DUF305 domain-containing protein [Amorphus orientalis]MDQ0316296.1 hypothetical protein [Amorphus orientalis]
MNYGRFFAMIATSTVVMFALMYFNTYLLSHVFWSETRAYMALVMGATMAVIMLAFMLSMYTNRAVNIAIFAGAIVLFGASLWLVRSQVTVQDRSYMKAMIPHHSIAIMTSSRANISDPRVRKLADEIIFAQDKEIAEMRYLIADIGESGDGSEGPTDPAAVTSLDEALSSAEIATLDPQFMSSEEMARLFPDGAACTFRYTKDSPPVLAFGERDGSAAAGLKISGDLVPLAAGSASATASPAAYRASGISVNLNAPDGAELTAEADRGRKPADLILELDRGLSVGYRGYYQCTA